MKELGQKIRKTRKITMIEVLFLIIGAVLGVLFDHLWNNYIYPLYFMPHSHLRVLYGDSMITIDNIGETPVEWVVITVKVSNPNSLIKSVEVIGSLDIRTPKPYAGGSYFWCVINNITPEDWGAIEFEIEGIPGISVEVKSSCQFEIGGKETVGPAPTHGMWGEEESYEEWLKQHQGNPE